MTDQIVVTGIDCMSNHGLGLSAIVAGISSEDKPYSAYRLDLLSGVINSQVGSLCQNDLVSAWTALTETANQFPTELCAGITAFCIRRALDQAGFDPAAEPEARIALILGNLEPVSAPFNDAEFESRSFNRITDFKLARPSDLLREICEAAGLSAGTKTMVNSACASGNVAFLLGEQLLRDDLADICIVGGCDLISPRVVAGFSKLRLVSQDQCRPFCNTRGSITISEGVAVAVLERRSDREAEPIAEFLGGAISNDAHHPTNPSLTGIEACIEAAHARADIKGDGIDVVMAHGTGSRLNDKIEGELIARHAPSAQLMAPKAFIGHTMGAAGAFGAILSCHTVGQRWIGPFSVADPELPLNFATGRLAPSDRPIVAQNNAFGFGGCNAVTLFRTSAST